MVLTFYCCQLHNLKLYSLGTVESLNCLRFVLILYDFNFSPQIAVRLLAHKIQSPQEWEAIQALMVRNIPLLH